MTKEKHSTAITPYVADETHWRVEDLDDLARAKKLLENPSFAIKAANYIGRPIEFALEKIDSKALDNATSKALRTALDTAIRSLDTKTEAPASKLKHTLLVGGSGAVGGFFGLAALAVELPVSTTLMLRSIADIARSQGEDLSDIAARFACLEVFALGSDRSREDDAGESAYFTARAALAYEMHTALRAVQQMSSQAIRDAITRGQMPILVRFVNAIASRFGVAVSEKLIAQSIPLIGAAGGAAINLMFIRHFQEMAEGHFIVRRLERRYGTDEVHNRYESLDW
jgi:hypothetical protein